MDEESVKQKKKQMLNLLIEARKLAEQEKYDEALNLLKPFAALEREVFGLFGKSGKFNLARNAVVSMCFPVTNEKERKSMERIRETGRKDSLRLIAEIKEELETEH